jgi:hypothetical protein
MDPTDLERLVGRKLRQLPVPRAPSTLLPRVMTAVEHWTRRPWYARAWLTWPLAWQIVSLAALVLIVGGGAVLVPTALAAAGDAMSTLVLGVKGEVAGTAHQVDAAINAGRVLWRALLEPLVAYAFAVVMLMCAACAAFGAALGRVALAGR